MDDETTATISKLLSQSVADGFQYKETTQQNTSLLMNDPKAKFQQNLHIYSTIGMRN